MSSVRSPVRSKSLLSSKSYHLACFIALAQRYLTATQRAALAASERYAREELVKKGEIVWRVTWISQTAAVSCSCERQRGLRGSRGGTRQARGGGGAAVRISGPESRRGTARHTEQALRLQRKCRGTTRHIGQAVRLRRETR